MVYQQRDASSEQARTLRKEGGQWLKKLREKAGLTQREIAQLLSLDYYTFISQLENGTGRIPPNLIIGYAQATGQNPADFAMQLTRYYDPHLFAALNWGRVEQHQSV